MSYAIEQQEWQSLPEHAQREIYDFFLFIKQRCEKQASQTTCVNSRRKIEKHIDAEIFLNQRAVLRLHSPILARTKEYRLMCDNKKYWLEFLIKSHFDEEIQAVQKYPLDWEESSNQLELLKTSKLPLLLTSEPWCDFPSFELSIFGLCTELRINWWGSQPSGCGVIANFATWLINQTKSSSKT